MSDDNAPLAEGKTAEQRAAEYRALRLLHPGNRFRLMAGLPLLDQGDWKPDAEKDFCEKEK